MKPRPFRQQFSSRVRLVVSGQDEILNRYAANLSERGLFVRDDSPPAVGSSVLIEFVLPDGQPLCRVAARVVHAHPALAAGDRTAGMGLEIVELDQVASGLVGRLDAERPSPDRPAGAEQEAQRLVLSRLEAPLILPEGPSIGIDLGTVNSCVAVAENGEARVVLSPQGYDTLPSVLFVRDGGEVFVGHKALERMILEPHRAIYGSKRFLGRPFTSREVQTYGHFFNYELVAGADGRTAALVGQEQLALEAVSAHILATLKEGAEQHLGRKVSRAVVTIPAYFGETQRQAVRDAGRMAGLLVERLLNEPTAAAVAYGYGRNMSKTILVYDLGGGTFDATVLHVEADTFEVLATDGDPFLGGSDFDDRLTEYVLSTFERGDGVHLRDDPVAVQRVRFAVELAKRQLSDAVSVALDLPYIAQAPGGPVHLRSTLSRELLERLTGDLIERTLGIVQVVLDRAGVAASELDDVLLVGGQSRSPMVRRLLQERFGRRPSTAVHPTEAVALGAAIIADTLHGDRHLHLADILPATISVANPDGSLTPLVRRGARLPAEAELEVAPAGRGTAGIKVLLYRGEAPEPAGNTFLGALSFPPIASSAALAAKARVKLRISGDGLLSVTARHPVTGEIKELDLSLSRG